MSTVFCTYTYHDDSDDCYRRFGGEKLEKSLKYFYPDIPFVAFKNILSDRECKDGRTFKSVLGMRLAEQYDHVIVFDCDSVVVDKLDELFTNDYDIASVRNQNDKSHSGTSGPFSIEGLDIFKYMNAGLLSVRNKQFWKDWYDYNEEHNVHTWGMAEQDSMNILAWKSGKYKTKLLDPLDSDVYYGISNTWGDKGGCEPADSQGGSHWDSWKHIVAKSDGLYLESPRTHKMCKIKVFHHAGGGHERLRECDFNKEAWDYIQEIIK